ncbi:hypothetical protein H7X46_24725 [Pseudonocardia sp. C8]|uniref:hypothetical protein n=1 Tax=Pseudonocardia sp. C8 TaxID=2762759 RepID=UPI001642AE9F|nr:hypothetical protein [Pseudonocardia sp. C8]MBC3194260.1 hypothetical protein [Pseudonocardia sp. C8]
MNPTPARRRRMVAAAAFATCLIVAGPAAYAAGAATADQEDTGNVSTESPAEPGAGITGSAGGHDHSASAGPDTGTAEGSGSAPASAEATAPDASGGQEAVDPGAAPAQDGGAPDDTTAQDGGEAQDDGNGQDDEPGRGDGPDQAAAPGGLDVLASDCSGSRLAPHDGFQKAPRCVSTAFGEVAAADQSPSLLITDAPDRVAPGQPFTLKVSTRNLVRDRFLAAAQGGYYVEASLLNGEGLQRGHFHTACRTLPNPDEAPDSAPDPAFFEATEDGGGGSTPDEVTIEVPGSSRRASCSARPGRGTARTAPR